MAVALNPSPLGQISAQRLDGVLGVLFLDEAHQCVKHDDGENGDPQHH